jgi:undecaprenyl-diphosphatase
LTWAKREHADDAESRGLGADVMMRGWRREERLMWKLVGTGSRKGTSAPSRAGDVLRQPVVWAVFAGGLALSGHRGRRAAVRGSACAATASIIHLPIKRLFRRPRPLGAGIRAVGPLTSSFPSGHTAADLSFIFGAAQELPVLLLPLSISTLGSHWSLLRARKHYPSDIVAGGVIALAVNAAAWKLRPPLAMTTTRRPPDRGSTAGPLSGR